MAARFCGAGTGTRAAGRGVDHIATSLMPPALFVGFACFPVCLLPSLHVFCFPFLMVFLFTVPLRPSSFGNVPLKRSGAGEGRGVTSFGTQKDPPRVHTSFPVFLLAGLHVSLFSCFLVYHLTCFLFCLIFFSWGDTTP
jgi:hypothetical protein